MSFFALISAILGATLLYMMTAALPRKNLPPGPPRKPLVGNVWDLPPAGAQDWMHWLKYKERYGMDLEGYALGKLNISANIRA
jgi:hypothetical protein